MEESSKALLFVDVDDWFGSSGPRMVGCSSGSESTSRVVEEGCVIIWSFGEDGNGKGKERMLWSSFRFVLSELEGIAFRRAGCLRLTLAFPSKSSMEASFGASNLMSAVSLASSRIDVNALNTSSSSLVRTGSVSVG